MAARLLALAGAAHQPPLPTLTAAQWQADVETFLRQLPQKHANAFHHLSRAEYEAAAAALRARVASSNSDEILTRFYEFLPKGSPPTVVPDHTIEPTWDRNLAPGGERAHAGRHRRSRICSRGWSR